MTTSATIWPRAYLLQIYEQAISNGMVWIEPISPSQATSLRMALYRLRRRSDSNNAAFITPQHHLVTVGAYDPARQRLPILYNRLPEAELPAIHAATGEELALALDPPAPATPPSSLVETAEILNSAAEIQIDETDILSYVERMKRNALEKKNG